MREPASFPIGWVKTVGCGLFFVMLSGFASDLYAAAATSNYILPSDVQDAGGGEKAKSTNYQLSDTIGEPNIGESDTLGYELNAGYRQTGNYLALSGPATINLGTIVGTGQATQSGTWLVTTDADAGYQLSWQASTGSMVSGSNTIASFSSTTPNTPDTWSVAAANSAWGARISSRSTDTSPEWGTDGSSDKWLNVSTTGRTIISTTARTSISGSREYIQFRTDVGATHVQPTGLYTVTITITATAL